MKQGLDEDSDLESIVEALEIFKKLERRLSRRRKKHKRKEGKFKKHKNPRRIPGHNHDWNDCPKNRFKKKEETNKIGSESSEDSSNDESDFGIQCYDTSDDENLCSYDTNPKTMPNLLIRKDYSSDEDTDNDRNTKIPVLVIQNNECCSSDKEYEELNKIEDKQNKSMSAEILISVPVENDENMVLLGLVNTGTFKTLGKASRMKSVTGVKYEQMKKPTKWKTKAGIFTTKETASIKDAHLLQFTTKRSFDINKMHLFNDLDEKYDIILGRDAYQIIGLDILNSTKQFYGMN